MRPLSISRCDAASIAAMSTVCPISNSLTLITCSRERRCKPSISIFASFILGCWPGVVVPAAIARAVSDEGAVLRHPEVLECDASWREQNSGEAISPEVLNFGDLAESFASIQKLEGWRSKLVFDSDEPGLRRLRAVVRKIRE